MKRIVCTLFILLLVGCSEKNKTAELEMHCNGLVSRVEIRKKDTFTCTMLDDDYKFKVKSISDDEIVLEADKFGLADENNLEQEEKKFIISKDKELTLVTQTLDYQESVSFVWK